MPGLLSQPALVTGETARRCPACGSADLRVLGPVPEAFHFCAFRFHHPINRANLIECAECDFHFKNPCLPAAMLDDIYRQQPATVWGSTVEGREDVPLIAELLEAMPHRDIRLLDVGCYTGGLLRALAQRFESRKTLRLHGVEPSALAATEAATHGIHILGATIADLPVGTCFDLVLLTDVFEHILHSKNFLHTLCEFVAQGGYLVVLTGAYDSVPFSLRRNTFHYCAMPEHLAFLSRRHAVWLSSQLGMELSQYTILSHVNPPPSRAKALAKTLAHWSVCWIPSAWLNADHSVIHEIARWRGMGVQNLSGKPDHAFAVFHRPADAA